MLKTGWFKWVSNQTAFRHARRPRLRPVRRDGTPDRLLDAGQSLIFYCNSPDISEWPNFSKQNMNLALETKHGEGKGEGKKFPPNLFGLEVR